MRLNGATYASIAQSGGGIKSTVNATRQASFEQLYKFARQRMEMMINQGCLGFEIKSGYGLDIVTECKMLQVAKQLSNDLGVKVHRTFLGAHALPREFEGQADKYIDFICEDVLPKIRSENLADSVDVFCESIGFSLKQTEKVFDKALELGLNIKCHAEQLSLMGATQSASKRGALSCDHLEFLDEAGIKQMKKSGSVAVLLPGAFYFLKESQKPPVALFRKYQVPMAIATDYNPGSSPTNSLALMMNMACVLFGLTVKEAWLGVTNHSALALDWQMPALKEGQTANFVIWPFSKPVDLIYSFGHNVLPRVFIDGKQSFFRGCF
jgi:imidazolonepropionase